MEEKTNLRKMEELDAKIEKVNYDLLSLETRKKEMEEKKIGGQQNIEQLEEDKKNILAKTDKMSKLQKMFYIAFASKNDLKQIDWINARIIEYKKEKETIQNRIDVQNKLYTDTIKEKENYLKQRRKLYIENTNTFKIQEEENQEKTGPTSHIEDLVKIHEITKKYQDSKIMESLRKLIESQVNRLLNPIEDKKRTRNEKESEEQEEIE